MSTSAKIDAVAAGTDTTNPYDPYLTGLDALVTIATGFSFNDIGSDPLMADAITAFDDEVVLFSAKIDELKTIINNYWSMWWNDEFQNYKNRPTLLAAADGIKADVLAAESLPPVDPSLTWSTTGTISWSDAELAQYDTNISDVTVTLGTIVDGDVTFATEVDSETAKITTAISEVNAFIAPFSAHISTEATAYTEALQYVNAYAYVNTIEANPTDPKIQEIATKFSGNLP